MSEDACTVSVQVGLRARGLYWLPPQVMFVQARHDVSIDTAWPQELAQLRGMTQARQAESITVRHCARAALLRVGVPPAAVVRDDWGAPIWPTGVVGSMTHCQGFRAAAVARQGDLAALGIDAEPARPLPSRVLSHITSDGERCHIAELARCDATMPWDKVLFSAKESVYKAWYPLARAGLGFRDVNVVLHPDGRGEIGFLKQVPAAIEQLDWHLAWALEDAVIVTAAWAVSPAALV